VAKTSVSIEKWPLLQKLPLEELNVRHTAITHQDALKLKQLFPQCRVVQ